MKYGDAIKVSDLQENKKNIDFLILHFITLQKYFEKFDEIVLDEKKLDLFLNGVKLHSNLNDGVYRINCKENIIGIGIVEKNMLKRDIIL